MSGLAQRVRCDGVACAMPQRLLDACAVTWCLFVQAQGAALHACCILVNEQLPLRGIRRPHEAVLYPLNLDNLQAKRLWTMEAVLLPCSVTEDLM